MSERTRTVAGVLAIAAFCVLFATVIVHQVGSAEPQHSSTQYGCTFSVPKPVIRQGKAFFAQPITCTAAKDIRLLDVELVGDDPTYDDTVGGASKTLAVGRAGTRVIAGKGWSCQEDPVGKDEVFVRVRIQQRLHHRWTPSSWVNGATASGNCH